MQGGDANGNLSEIVTRRSMFHDSMNRMTAIAGVTTGTGPYDGWLQASQYPAIHSSAFLYDPDGRQIVRTSTRENNLRYAYAGDMVIADINDQGGSGIVGRITTRYVPGASIDERVAMITTNTATCSSLNGTTSYGGNPCASASYEFYHADRQGNVIAMVNSSGTMTAQYVYPRFRGDKHGRSRSRTRSGSVEEPYNASGNPYRYTGRRLEAEWGILNYRARYYDPALGRFYQTDPILYQDQFNLYAYVGNDPLNRTDPTGECSTDGEGNLVDCPEVSQDANGVLIQGADFNGYQKDAVAAPDMATLAATVGVLDAITSTPAGRDLLAGAQQANGVTESNTFVDLGVTQADMVADGAHTPSAQTFTVVVGSQSHSFVSSSEFLPVEVQGPGGATQPGEATFAERVAHEELHNANPAASESQVQRMMDRLMPSGRRIRH